MSPHRSPPRRQGCATSRLCWLADKDRSDIEASTGFWAGCSTPQAGDGSPGGQVMGVSAPSRVKECLTISP